MFAGVSVRREPGAGRAYIELIKKNSYVSTRFSKRRIHGRTPVTPRQVFDM